MQTQTASPSKKQFPTNNANQAGIINIQTPSCTNLLFYPLFLLFTRTWWQLRYFYLFIFFISHQSHKSNMLFFWLMQDRAWTWQNQFYFKKPDRIFIIGMLEMLKKKPKKTKQKPQRVKKKRPLHVSEDANYFSCGWWNKLNWRWDGICWFPQQLMFYKLFCWSLNGTGLGLDLKLSGTLHINWIVDYNLHCRFACCSALIWTNWINKRVYIR